VVTFPHPVHNVQPLGRARVAVVVLLEVHAVLTGLVGPPGGDDVERKTPAATYVVYVRGLLRQKRGVVKGRANGDHQLQTLGDCGQCRGR
jgi:hypothetical protein